MNQLDGSLSDGTDTYTGVKLDAISWDETNQQLLLRKRGAATVIPFSGGNKFGYFLITWPGDTNCSFSQALNLDGSVATNINDCDFVSALTAYSSTNAQITFSIDGTFYEETATNGVHVTAGVPFRINGVNSANIWRGYLFIAD